MGQSHLVTVYLLLHGCFVLLQVGQSLLQQRVLFLLRGDRGVVGVADLLQARHQVAHAVVVERFQIVPHLLNLSPVLLLLLTVVLQLVVGVLNIPLARVRSKL